MRLIYLDSVIVIYAVDGTAFFQPRARAHIANLRAAGDQMAVSDLTWLECRIKSFRLGDAKLLADYHTFLTAPDIRKVPLPTPVYERATLRNYPRTAKMALKHGCFQRFSGFSDSFLFEPITTTSLVTRSTWPQPWRTVVMCFSPTING
jgi:hypothetical protein